MDSASQVQILDEVVRISLSANTLGEDMKPSVLSVSATGEQYDILGSLVLVQ